MMNLKTVLLISALWVIIPALYLYILFPIMSTVAMAVKELSLVANIAFLGMSSTFILWGVFMLIKHFSTPKS
ncbi:hypothetical protein [Spirosoma endbachense]|uniref:Superinfection immunity protein n=1 Tax=Spirosoma endbachense TaxID=2666025 RepID=A0A6P1W1V1_9BACT|nr:hypothetical protein [Spirosoma endbachense]QHV97969.1 hypothetical protein GJR95_24465 [Spirosoma endbachense]